MPGASPPGQGTGKRLLAGQAMSMIITASTLPRLQERGQRSPAPSQPGPPPEKDKIQKADTDLEWLLIELEAAAPLRRQGRSRLSFRSLALLHPVADAGLGL